MLPSRRARARRHPVRGQCEDGRSRLVDEDARIARWPPRAELRAVEEQRHDEAGTDPAHEVGYLVEPRQVLAHERRQRHTGADVDDVQDALADVDRLPPQLLRRERPRQVVLAYLRFVEEPAMVLVLLVPLPAGRAADPEPKVVAPERAGPRRLANPGDEQAHAVLVERPLEARDVIRIDGALGKENRVDVTDVVERGLHQRVQETEVELL